MLTLRGNDDGNEERCKGERLLRQNKLQDMMNYAVRRCGGKMRKFDWGHIVAELKEFDLKPYSAKQLEEAKNEAIERYMIE